MSDTSHVTNEQMQNAYKCLVEQITAISQSQQSYPEIFRLLNRTRIEFDSLESSLLYELGKNKLKEMYQRKAILFLESEIDLLKLLFLHANQPLNSVIPQKSKVYFIPKPSLDLGIDSMGEFAATFELSGQFIDEEGKPAHFICIAEALQLAFNFTFGDAYKSKSRVFSRKPFNLTRTLDHLKNLLIRESQNKNNKQDEK